MNIKSYLTLPPISQNNVNNSAEELHESSGVRNKQMETRRPCYEENLYS